MVSIKVLVLVIKVASPLTVGLLVFVGITAHNFFCRFFVSLCSAAAFLFLPRLANICMACFFLRL